MPTSKPTKSSALKPRALNPATFANRHPESAHDILSAVRPNPLASVFAPRTVAVIGATEKVGSVGAAVMKNLQTFKGPVYPINPKRSTIMGLPAFPTIGQAPEKIDLAVIVTPAVSVPGIIKECAQAGVPAAIIISAGFKETGPAGAELERQVLAEAQAARIRIVGPNCLGVMTPHTGLNATFAATLAQPGNVAFISQSGALCTAILDWSLREKVGFSAFASLGSMLDVGWGDLIYYLGDDPHTRSIVIYMETVGDAQAFLSAAREVAYTKPIIVIKVGRTQAAAKAAASHTGSLTGSDEVLDAAFRRVGVVRVDTIAELFDMAEVLSKQPRPRGPKLAIVTNAGGPGALATDMLVESGGQISEITSDSLASLNALLPPHWSHGNPIDVLGDASPETYARATEIAAKDPNTDGVLVVLTPQAMTDATRTAELLAPFAHNTGKPVLATWMGGPAVDQGERILNDASIPTFKYPDRAARAFALMWRYSQNLHALYETPTLPSTLAAKGKTRNPELKQVLAGQKEAATIIARARDQGRTLLTEEESKHVLSCYGIPVVETLVATTKDEAVTHAEKIGYPVVLKLYSKTITHKTDVGGVQLNLKNAAAVRQAWLAIKEAVTTKAGAEHFLGVTVQAMIPADGHELILGSSMDPQFGPVLLFGAGGQLVEVFKDRALGLPPLNATLARRLMEQTKIFTALKGVRGQAPVDLPALEALLTHFSQLVVEQRWISEIDINPLRVSAGRMTALDARIVLHPLDTKEEKLPRAAIRPYPAQYVSRWKLKNGTPLTIRPIRPEDEPLLATFHRSLSERSVYYRYFSPLRLEQRVAHDRLARLCFIDYDREMALVAEREGDEPGTTEIIGVGRLSKLHWAREAEFALIISDQYQRQGLGTQLLKLLLAVGKSEQVERVRATILPENAGMQAICHACGFKIKTDLTNAECLAEIQLV